MLVNYNEMENKDESTRRAELFDILAHPVRIRILKMLQQNPMSFSELKRALGIESSGHLQYHLEKLCDLVKQDAYGKYIMSDDAKEVMRFTEIVEQMGAAKPVRFWRPSTLKKALSLMVIVLLVSIVTIPEIHRVASRQIPLYENIDFSEDFLTVGGIKFRYLLITTSELENGTKITFRGVTFTYLAPTTLRLRECLWVLTSKPVSEMEVFSAGVKVEYEDGLSEIIPILLWTGGGEGYAGLVRFLDQGEILYSPFYCKEKIRALAFQIGSKTIALLVRA
jgi:DNA-binding transcriptional ArsR family regulator